MPSCTVCDAPTTPACAYCTAQFYCSQSCQKKHWKAGHRDECRIPVTLELMSGVVQTHHIARGLSFEAMRGIVADGMGCDADDVLLVKHDCSCVTREDRVLKPIRLSVVTEIGVGCPFCVHDCQLAHAGSFAGRSCHCQLAYTIDFALRGEALS